MSVTNQADPPSAMPVEQAVRVLTDLRSQRDVVVTHQGSARLWPRLSKQLLDFNYNPSTMGGAVPLGVGLALAQPQRHVIVVCGDGSLLMSLGSLVTAAGSGVANLSIVLLDNGMYEVTGGQKTPAARSQTDYAGLARAADFPNVSQFWDLEDWRRRAPGIFRQRGPRFVWLVVQPMQEDCLLDSPPPIDQEVARLREALLSGS